MKIHYTLALLFGALLISVAASSQDIQTSTIEWNCTSTFTARPGTTADEITKVVSSSDQVIWYDKDGVVIKTLSITDTTGSWSNVSGTGTIQFGITSGDDAGLVQFSRSNGVARIRIQLINGDDSQIYELVVDNLHAL